MHTSGLHFFDPSKPELDRAFTFVDTVTGNKQGFSQLQLRGAKKALELYAFCKYPSIKDFKWIQSPGKGVIDNPPGPEGSSNPARPFTPERVQRGGSFLCNDSYCSRYRPSAAFGDMTQISQIELMHPRVAGVPAGPTRKRDRADPTLRPAAVLHADAAERVTCLACRRVVPLGQADRGRHAWRRSGIRAQHSSHGRHR